jgi:hypothetical protein
MVSLIDIEFLPTVPTVLDLNIPHIGRDAALDQDFKPAIKKIAEELTASSADSKWIKLLAAGTPDFVPVKRYSVAELFRLRKNASKNVEVDVHHIENSIVSARQRAEFQSPIPLVNMIPMVEPLFVPLYVRVCEEGLRAQGLGQCEVVFAHGGSHQQRRGGGAGAATEGEEGAPVAEGRQEAPEPEQEGGSTG